MTITTMMPVARSVASEAEELEVVAAAAAAAAATVGATFAMACADWWLWRRNTLRLGGQYGFFFLS